MCGEAQGHRLPVPGAQEPGQAEHRYRQHRAESVVGEAVAADGKLQEVSFHAQYDCSVECLALLSLSYFTSHLSAPASSHAETLVTSTSITTTITARTWAGGRPT